ncbi:hypothetical protein ACIO3O_14370 [Streptomyces sp. NPDC087440]|uniref:hypothetical protein n=1 Tax=Streptomyces sp. NPDC087440 TaxID=3365790 RepID=UPI0037FC1C45
MAMNGHGGPPYDNGPGNDHEGGPDDDLLPCGRSLYEVWAQHEATPDASPRTPGHPADCVHCAAALEDLRTLDDFVQRTRTEDANAPAPDASAVASRVMDLVRLELRPGRTLPLGEPEEDHWIVEAAAAKTLRGAAETVAGVRAGSCRVAPAAGPGAGARGPVRVTVEVEAGTRRALPALAEAVRTAVARAADRAIGMRVSEVDVLVVDLFDEDAADFDEDAADPDQDGADGDTAAPERGRRDLRGETDEEL